MARAVTVVRDKHSKSRKSGNEVGGEKSPGMPKRIGAAAAAGAVVVTLTPTLVDAVPLVGVLAGDTMHVDSAGAPEQAKERLPATPPVGAIFSE